MFIKKVLVVYNCRVSEQTLIGEDIVETPLTYKKNAISCCWINEQRQKKSKMECLRKLFDRYFDREVFVYMRYRNMRCTMTRNCMGCTIQDPGQRYYECIARSSIKWIECNFSEMLNKVDLYMVYELTKSYLADRFSTKEIDESYPFYTPESYLTNTVWCRKIKENLISNYMGEETN